MESKMVISTLEDGTVIQPLSATEAVAEVLCKDKSKPTFLKNVGLISSRKKTTKSQLQLQLDAQRAGKHELQALVHDFQQAKEQSDADRNTIQQQIQEMWMDQASSKKSLEETNALIQKLVTTVASKDGTG